MIQQEILAREGLTSGIGVRLPDGAHDWHEVIEAAGLDWEVKKGLAYGRINRRFKRLHGYAVTYRDDTGQALGVVSKGYPVIQNRDAMPFLDPLLQSGDVKNLVAGSLYHGAHVFVSADIGEGFTINGLEYAQDRMGAKVNDLYQPKLLIQTRHDGGGALSARFMVTRLICTNGLTASAIVGRINVRHHGDVVGNLIEARRLMSGALVYKRQVQEMAESMLEKRLSMFQIESLTQRLVPSTSPMDEPVTPRVEARREALRGVLRNGTGLAGFSDTGWGVYQAVAEFADHGLPYRNTRLGSAAEHRFESIAGGTAARLKDEAYRFIMAAEPIR